MEVQKQSIWWESLAVEVTIDWEAVIACWIWWVFI